MKTQVKRLLSTGAAALGALLVATQTSIAVMASAAQQAQQGVDASGQQGSPTFEDTVAIVTNLLIFLVGIAAVIMIIIGAIKYTTANGDQSSLTSAKNTILYSIVGLILAVAAYGIVNFVVSQFP